MTHTKFPLYDNCNVQGFGTAFDIKVNIGLELFVSPLLNWMNLYNDGLK